MREDYEKEEKDQGDWERQGPSQYSLFAKTDVENIACKGNSQRIDAPDWILRVVVLQCLFYGVCDYWDKVKLVRWPSLDKFLEENLKDDMWFFTGRVSNSFRNAEYTEDSWLVFGRETAGLPPKLIEAHKDHCLRIPMKDGLRSLNLSNSVAVAAYEALGKLDDLNLV